MKEELNIPYGYCHCGCGQKTKIAKKTYKRYGHIKGKPVKFISGHQLKGKFGKDHPKWKGGRTIDKHKHTNYVKVTMPEHPRTDSQGYVYEHLLVVEADWGCPLPAGSVVHHVDGNGLNNKLSNLMVFRNHADHARWHALLRANKNT